MRKAQKKPLLSLDHTAAPAAREALWKRLGELLERCSAGTLDRLADGEVEELGRLYRAAATHLAMLQAFGASARQREELNRLVSRAHSAIYGRHRQGKNLELFFWSFLAFPQTVRRTAPYHLLAALLLFLGGLYGYFGSARDSEWALEFVPLGDDRTPYATREELAATLLQGRPVEDREAKAKRPTVEDGGSGSGRKARSVESPEKAIFAAMLWRHNTTIALTAFFAGFLAGMPTVFVLLMNGAFLGVYTHTFHASGLAFEWWAWLLPHGVTELLAIILLSGGGLFIGHQVISPGKKSRADALRDARGQITQLLLFAFPMLLLAALIESFVRQSSLSDPGRYVFALTTLLGWGVYLGWARVPLWARAQLEARRTIAERAVPLPVDEEILGAGQSAPLNRTWR